MVSSPGRGAFVTVEGLDFSGKTTLVENLKSLVAGTDVALHFTREPGGTPVAERVRALLLDPDVDLEPWTEAYLYAAARAEHVRREITPRLETGESVFCERYLDSSVAYQGSGRGLGVKAVREVNARAVGTVVPDRTFYLRLDAGERERRARRRARESGAAPDRIERSGSDFLERVERGFETLVAAEPERIRVLDAARPPEQLADEVWREIERLHYTLAR